VVFGFGPKKLTLQARGAATGRSKVELPLEYDGKAINIGFDPKYVTDMLRVLTPDDALTLELIDGNSVALFKNGDQYSYIVMPLS
jgi:DNA polymerase-3 subunit beta